MQNIINCLTEKLISDSTKTFLKSGYNNLNEYSKSFVLELIDNSSETEVCSYSWDHLPWQEELSDKILTFANYCNCEHSNNDDPYYFSLSLYIRDKNNDIVDIIGVAEFYASTIIDLQNIF